MQDLVDDLKSELSGDFEKVMVGLMMTTVGYDAHELKSAIKVSVVGSVLLHNWMSLTTICTHITVLTCRQGPSCVGCVLWSRTNWANTHSGVGSIWLVRRGHGRATTCELYAKIIAESELLQLALNEIHKFCFQHWSRGRGTCGTGSGAPDTLVSWATSLIEPWSTSYENCTSITCNDRIACIIATIFKNSCM